MTVSFTQELSASGRYGGFEISEQSAIGCNLMLPSHGEIYEVYATVAEKILQTEFAKFTIAGTFRIQPTDECLQGFGGKRLVNANAHASFGAGIEKH